MLRTSTLLLTYIFAISGITAPTNFSTVRMNGIGPVRVGMNLTELNKVLHTSYTKPTDPDEQGCTYVGIPNKPGIGLLILNGRVARIDVDDTSTHTPEGIRIGDSEARLRHAYGKRLMVQPHAYDPDNGHYLTLLSNDRRFGIRFETQDGRITRYYAGTTEAISYIEGCS